MHKKKAFLGFLILFLFGHSNVILAQLGLDDFAGDLYQGKTTLPYRLYSPPLKSKEDRLPLVIFLHGVGARGDDNQIQLAKTGFLELINQSGFPKKHPCFILAPQCAESANWSAQNGDALTGLIEQLVLDNQIDTNRIYITGQSMGGFGTWEAIRRDPKRFAAAAPICGGGDPDMSASFVHIPVWAFHGADDQVVKPEKSREMIESLKNAGGSPRYTELKGVGHASWVNAYGAPDLWDWMFRQQRKTVADEIKQIADVTSLPAKICFGSCSNQNKPQPILETVVRQHPDLFIYLGDNIYGDTKEMTVLAKKYAQLGAKREFQDLRANVPVLSVWDDHDYGWNDAGKEYEFKRESKQIFMDFWAVPEDSPRRDRPGIYGAHRIQGANQTLQIILLDTRTFRDPLKRNDKTNNGDKQFKNDYQPDATDKTLLGEKQWAWLEGVLREPADLRIICSSIQFGHEYNGWESWTNLPNEQQRMVDLIKESGAEGVLFISGDVHWGEISKREVAGLYPLYDVTASGITEDWHNVESNRFRIGEAFRSNHFGMLEIDWAGKRPVVTMSIIDVNGKKQNTHTVRY
jgi:alkaline phosphatase D